MATKQQKLDYLQTAIDITKAFAQGGDCKITPEVVLKTTYSTLLELHDEIEKTNA